MTDGDKIGVVSPSGPLYDYKLTSYQAGLAYLKGRNFNVIEGVSVFEQHGYLAGSDEQRTADINRMIRDPEIRAIFCTRGGFGASRILKSLDFQSLRENPKIVVGYSDVTILQLAFLSQIGLVTFSGPMVAVEMGQGIDRYTEDCFWRIVQNGEALELSPEKLGFTPVVYREGIAEGRLVGGCLSAMMSLAGTRFLPDFNDAILIVEDVGEHVYRLDRYFAQLSICGILDQVKGIIFGRFEDCPPDRKTNGPVLELEQVIQEYVKDLYIPVLGNFPYGHLARKFTLPIGCKIRLDTDRKSVKMLETGVLYDQTT
ncbi:LD-carboxypeptidase [candidate division KSB1 bacterium]|nr:LD-carboxypeptidase [candidate division KSB1 bacterium]